MAIPTVRSPRSRPIALWAIPVADLGGVARHVLDVGGHGLPGWDLVVLCPPGPFAEEARAKGLDVRTGAFGPGAGTVASVRTLRGVTRSLRPAVVHTHLAHADVIAALAGAGRHGHLVSTEHGIAVDDGVYHASSSTARVMAQVHRLRQHRLDGAIMVSYATREAVRGKWHPPESLPMAVIHNGIDRGVRPPERDPGLRIGAVARFAPEKRLEDLIDAFALVAADHPDAELVMAGEGALRDELEARAAAVGLTDRVTFPGYVDASVVFAELDVVVMPSVFENCSYTLLEAAARGCGVVATNVGGNPEILPPECLVPVGDVETMATVMVEQGLQTTRRPGLPPAWPTVGQMCSDTVAFYGRIGA